MRQEFFKFPRTPHLCWPLPRAPKDDRVLDSADVREFLSTDVIVEEKVDGANVGLSLDEDGEIRAQSRGSFLERGSHSQFHPMWAWISQRKAALTNALLDDRMLFGEWCFAMHSIRYDRLPDWFLGFDIYDVISKQFWSTQRRNEILRLAGLCQIPRLFAGRITLVDLMRMLESEQSRVGTGPVEGLYIRRERPNWLLARAKLVRPEFLLAIEEHWSYRPLERNKLIKVSVSQSFQ
jgi:hypothetical protein